MGLKVIIVGAGNSGPLLALYLQRAGHTPVIYDMFNPTDSPTHENPLFFGDLGGAIGISINGQRVLDDAGILEDILKVASEPFNNTIFAKIDGSSPVTLTNFEGNRNGFSKSYKTFTIMRMNLQHVIGMACSKAGIKYVLCSKLVKVEESEGGVKAYFADGTSATGDILVGADGAHSITRKSLFGDAHKAVFAKCITHVGVTELGNGKGLNGDDLDLDHVLAFYNDRSSNHATVFFKTAPNNSSWHITEVNLPAGENINDDWRPVSDLPKESARLAVLLEGWGGPKNHVEIVRAARRITSTPLYFVPPVPSFYKGRVVLIGDAAHAMLPYLGQGGNSALEDAGTLGHLLAELGDDWKTAFRLYNEIRQPRIKTIVAQTDIMAGMNNAWYGHFVVRVMAFVARYFGNLDKITGYDFLADTKAALALEKSKS
ncbi:hypothetical protein HK100_008735 [Physocladia obscura]|uniref:FAD-binding domain-containing protein n=1 Tax=Physocladia obscura TaxID=109957 RepID=A0AAD5XL01_9FUNG|nr:hypothetical protein HK100_008735 [Physocladia obscura]